MLQWIYDGKILVPKNEKGNTDCKLGIVSSDVEVFPITPDEYDSLEKAGIIASLNEIDGVMVDQYESDYIPASMLSKCISVFRQFNIKDSVFLLSLKAGLNNGYGIYTSF